MVQGRYRGKSYLISSVRGDSMLLSAYHLSGEHLVLASSEASITQSVDYLERASPEVCII